MAVRLNTTLNMTPRADLRAFLSERAPAVVSAVDWEAKPRAFVAALIDAIGALPDEPQGRLRAIFEQVEQLAGTDQGRQLMRSHVAGDPERAAIFDALEDVRACGLWLARTDAIAFERALAANYLHRKQHGQSWGAFLVAAESAPAPRIGDDRAGELLERLRPVLAQPSGATGRMRVDLSERLVADPADGQLRPHVQATVYSEGPPESMLAFKDASEMERRTVRPVIAAAAVFDPGDLSIEVVARGGRAVHQAMAEAFVQAVLDTDVPVRPVKRRDIDFSRFEARPVFPLQPGDAVSSVHVDRLVLGAPGEKGGLVTLERRSSDPAAGDVYEAAKEWFDGRNPIGRPGWRVIHARLRVAFHPEREGARAKVVAVELTRPNRSNLRDQTEAHRLIAHTMMTRWNLYRPEA